MVRQISSTLKKFTSFQALILLVSCLSFTLTWCVVKIHDSIDVELHLHPFITTCVFNYWDPDLRSICDFPEAPPARGTQSQNANGRQKKVKNAKKKSLNLKTFRTIKEQKDPSPKTYFTSRVFLGHARPWRVFVRRFQMFTQTYVGC
jgi:hypothetical protein